MRDSAKEALGSAVQSMVNVGIKVSFTKKELDELGVKVPLVKLSADDIKNIRKKMNLSQMVFAKLLNVSISSIRQWEQGVRKPSGSTMILLELLQKEPTVLNYRLDLEEDMIQQIGNDAVREAQRKSLENGIPNSYSKNGVLYFQLPDGTITMDNPFEKGELKRRLDALTKG